MTTGYICAACGETFMGEGRWLQSGYHGGIAPMQWWDLCPECMDGFAKWLDFHRESMREHSLESESVREQSESVRERRYESQGVTGCAERVTDGGELSHDTREKLEEDVRKNYAYSTTTLMYPPSANKTTDMLGALPVDTVIGWLDRQASITEREFFETACDGCERLGGEDDATVGELKAERDQWRDAYEDSERMRLELVKDLEHSRKWNDTWRDLVHRYEGLCDELLDERDAMRGEAS